MGLKRCPCESQGGGPKHPSPPHTPPPTAEQHRDKRQRLSAPEGIIEAQMPPPPAGSAHDSSDGLPTTTRPETGCQQSAQAAVDRETLSGQNRGQSLAAQAAEVTKPADLMARDNLPQQAADKRAPDPPQQAGLGVGVGACVQDGKQDPSHLGQDSAACIVNCSNDASGDQDMKAAVDVNQPEKGDGVVQQVQHPENAESGSGQPSLTAAEVRSHVLSKRGPSGFRCCRGGFAIDEDGAFVVRLHYDQHREFDEEDAEVAFVDDGTLRDLTLQSELRWRVAPTDAKVEATPITNETENLFDAEEVRRITLAAEEHQRRMYGQTTEEALLASVSHLPMTVQQRLASSVQEFTQKMAAGLRQVMEAKPPGNPDCAVVTSEDIRATCRKLGLPDPKRQFEFDE